MYKILLTEELPEETGLNPSRNGLQTVTLLEGLEEGKYDCAMGGSQKG